MALLRDWRRPGESMQETAHWMTRCLFSMIHIFREEWTDYRAENAQIELARPARTPSRRGLRRIPFNDSWNDVLQFVLASADRDGFGDVDEQHPMFEVYCRSRLSDRNPPGLNADIHSGSYRNPATMSATVLGPDGTPISEEHYATLVRILRRLCDECDFAYGRIDSDLLHTRLDEDCLNPLTVRPSYAFYTRECLDLLPAAVPPHYTALVTATGRGWVMDYVTAANPESAPDAATELWRLLPAASLSAELERRVMHRRPAHPVDAQGPV